MLYLDTVMMLSTRDDFPKGHNHFRDVLHELFELGILERTQILKSPKERKELTKYDTTVSKYEIRKYFATTDFQNLRYLCTKLLKANINHYDDIDKRAVFIPLKEVSNKIMIFKQI